VLRRFAEHVGAIGIRNDQSGVRRKNLGWHILREGEEQPVAMGAVVFPFVVGAEVLH
jgi:hypothetical protein